MAKKEEVKELKKGSAMFTLVGKAFVNDFTFKLDSVSKNSPYLYSSMKLGVDCGDSGIIFAEMMGGYSTAKNAKNIVYAHGKKTNEAGKVVDDYKSKIEIDWDDRFNEKIISAVGENCFLTVGIEKKEDGKTFYKKFLSSYDAIQYVNDHLTKDTVIRVMGNLKYSEYDGSTQVKKEITSIALSTKEPADFSATFMQSILIDTDSVDKLDKDTNTYPISAYVVDYVGKVDTKAGKVEIKKNCVFPKLFQLEHMSDELTPKLIKKLFGAKKDNIWEVKFEGKISKGGTTVTTTLADLPEDIRELVELGVLDEAEAIEKCVGKGSRVENYILTKPVIKRTEKDGVVTPSIEISPDAYKDTDLVFMAQLLEGAGVPSEAPVVEDVEEEDLSSLLDGLDD